MITLNSTKKYSSKYHLKKEIEIIIEKLYDIKRTYQLYRELLSEDNNSVICNKFPYMFSIIIKAMEEKTILGLYKIVYDKDNNDKNICISDVIETYKKNKTYFTEKRYYFIKNLENDKRIRRHLNPKKINTCIVQLDKNLKKIKGMKEFLRNFRRKNLAHLDKKFTFNTRIKYYKGKITYGDIEAFIDSLIDDMNDLYNSLFGTSYVFLYNELDELKYLNKLIKCNINTRLKH